MKRRAGRTKVWGSGLIDATSKRGGRTWLPTRKTANRTRPRNREFRILTDTLYVVVIVHFLYSDAHELFSALSKTGRMAGLNCWEL